MSSISRQTLDIEDRADAHTTSRALRSPPRRRAMGPNAPCLLDLHTCKYTGVTYSRRVGGSGAPGTPPPLGNGRAFDQASFFRLLIVRADTIGAEVASCSR